MTRPPLARFMPRTPRAPRPIGRTSFSSKRTALPSLEKSITSCLPSVSATPTRQSPSSRSTAMIPDGRGRENSASEVFFTTPSCVAKNTYCSSWNSFTGRMALMRSPSSIFSRFTIGLPRLVRLPCGTS